MGRTKYSELPKQVRNGLQARIDNAVAKYGYRAFRTATLHHINTEQQRSHLADDIKKKEAELARLKRNA